MEIPRAGRLTELHVSLAVGHALERQARVEHQVHGAGEVVEHESEFLSWSGFKSYPTPSQRPHPPILIGGTTKKTLERVINAADGTLLKAILETHYLTDDEIRRGSEICVRAGADFVKTGVPLLLLTYVVTLVVTPLIFPFYLG